MPAARPAPSSAALRPCQAGSAASPQPDEARQPAPDSAPAQPPQARRPAARRSTPNWLAAPATSRKSGAGRPATAAPYRPQRNHATAPRPRSALWPNQTISADGQGPSGPPPGDPQHHSRRHKRRPKSRLDAPQFRRAHHETGVKGKKGRTAALSLMPIMRRTIKPAPIIYTDNFAADYVIDVSELRHQHINLRQRF